MSDEPDRPKFTVVAENTQQEIETTWLQGIVDQRLRALAANIIRVVRGAGRPEDIIDQCGEVLAATLEFDQKTGRYLSPYSVAIALGLKEEEIRDYDSFEGQRQLALHQMIKGSLQVTASRLLGQLTQEHRGESEMLEGFRELRGIYDDARKRREAAERVARAKTAPKRKPAKKRASKPANRA